MGPVRDEDGCFRRLVDMERAESFRATYGGGPGTAGAARQNVGQFLDRLEAVQPPGDPEMRDDVLLVVSELVSNAVRFAPGPVTLWLRSTGEGLHLMMSDTSTALPCVRKGRGPGNRGRGWPTVNALSDQVNVLARADGKDIHVFMLW